MNTKEKTYFAAAACFGTIALISFLHARAIITFSQSPVTIILIWLSGLLCTLFFCYSIHKATNSYSNLPDNDRKGIRNNNKIPSISRLGIIVIILSVILFYASFSFVLSLTWLTGDDFGFGPFPGYGYNFNEALHLAGRRYFWWVSRPGDIIASVFRLHPSRWQEVYITPLFIALLPICAIRFFKFPLKFAATLPGILFFWFFCSLCLVSGGMYDHSWRVFWCYAASCTYLWPVVFIVLLLSLYSNNLHDERPGLIKGCLAFLCGIYSGWGLECITPTLVVGLSGWILYRFIRGRYISPACRIAYLGCIVGAYLLFCSPALHTRTINNSRSRIFDPAMHTAQELQEFIAALSPEKLVMLRGNNGAEVITLSDIPLASRIHFVPYLAEEFWNYSAPLWFITGIVLCYLIISYASHHKKGFYKRSNILLLTVPYILSLACAFSYLLGCIPHSYALWPPTFIACLITGYLFCILSKKHIFIAGAITLATMCYALWNIVPSAVEAYNYKPYQHRWISLIEQQKCDGKQDIEIDYLLPHEPNDSLRLFTLKRCLQESPDSKQNKWASYCFSVHSIFVRKRFLDK